MKRTVEKLNQTMFTLWTRNAMYHPSGAWDCVFIVWTDHIVSTYYHGVGSRVPYQRKDFIKN